MTTAASRQKHHVGLAARVLETVLVERDEAAGGQSDDQQPGMLRPVPITSVLKFILLTHQFICDKAEKASQIYPGSALVELASRAPAESRSSASGTTGTAVSEHPWPRSAGKE